MPTLEEYATHSPYTDPGRHGPLLDALPADVRELVAVVRNVIVHYGSTWVHFDDAHLREIDNRWVRRILDCDQRRFPVPLRRARPERRRVAGCCRDYTLLTVAALRQRGTPARSRVGFSTYFAPDFNGDHVVAEYWDGNRWVRVDVQTPPGPQLPFDPADIPNPPAGGPFLSAAEVWSKYRRGETDADRHGVMTPGSPLRGPWFVAVYLLQELAHRQRDELLLWDLWGGMAANADEFAGREPAVLDEVAALLLAADAGGADAEAELAAWYARDSRINPGGRVRCLSPTGRTTWVDLSIQ